MTAETVLNYRPRGAARELFARRDDEVLLSGPAGTGKSRGNLEKIHLALSKYPEARGLLVRKTRASLTTTGMVTFEQKVLHPLDEVIWNGQDQAYGYPNGALLAVAGMDKASKVMSSEWDIIFAQEATELVEDDWEKLTTRLRNWKMPYQQLIADCNPDAPKHWLKHRADTGRTVMLESRHEDNPELFDDSGAITERGKAYIAKLDALTGVRYLRLRKGVWAAAEGMVYDGWDRSIHLIDRFEIPPEWPRIWAVDFGYTHPFVWQAWAIDPDGRLFRYREIYRTQRLVQDHARDIKQAANGEPIPVGIICDHDAEDRATLERHLGLGTVAAYKSVSPGIQAVADRLKKAGDDRARLFLLRDSLYERDEALAEDRKPTCTEEEIEAYVWDRSSNRSKGEEPVKRDDHGCDTMRYLVAAVDGLNQDPSEVEGVAIYHSPVRISPF